VFTQPSELEFDELLNALIGQPEERVVIIDCSLLAHDVLPLFCAVVGRLILELRAHSIPSNRTDQPYVLVLEEAHNYLKPRREDELPGTTAAREAFERIAKEGRKFGLSLIIASQRPSDVSATVLSQCANFLVHRIQNPEDLDYFKKILPTGSRDLLDQLPILAPGDAILLGSATNVPARVTVRLPHPAPQSETPKPWKAWQSSSPPFDVATSAAQWIQETGTLDAEAVEDDPDEPEPPEDSPF
jgi:DNA helicase HerA-like ATPase